LATTSVVAGSVAWSSAACYAQLAYDDATDPVYADGWTAGDNGGFGFTPWNFDNDPGAVGTTTIDSTSPFNDLGAAWRLATDPDITRAGRGFAPLQTGQTLRMVVDNPTDQAFFKGYIIRLNTGGGNICYGGSPCTPGTTPKERLGVYVFEYFTYGNWLVSDLADDNRHSTLFDTDTAAGGVQIDVKITGPESYELTMDPRGAAATYTQSGSLGNTGTGAVNWIEFLFFNTPPDPNFATDFYIKSLEILGSAPPGVAGDYNNNNKVDAADYTVWRDHLNQTFQLQHEVSGVTPGMVTVEDYNEWANRFGQMAGSGAAAVAGAVPEPNSLVYVVAACAGLASLTARGVCAQSVTPHSPTV
jgi:hypothetical protein